MTDRELLENAAKAAGYVIRVSTRWKNTVVCQVTLDDGSTNYVRWNPITDDGDALRLKKARHMTVAWEPSRGGWSVGAIVSGEFRWLAFDEDCNRAITRAAAEIGKGMK